MRALSVKQPWAWLLIHGAADVGLDKDVENRSWSTQYRGRLLIHASEKASLETYHEARMFIQRTIGLDAALRFPQPLSGAFRHGGIIGAVTLADVRPPTRAGESKWHMPGYFGWVMTERVALPFYHAKGQLRFWGDFAIRDGVVTRA